MVNREEIIDKLAQSDTDNMDLADLMSYFYSNQYDYYSSLTDNELLMEVEQHDELAEQYKNLCSN